MTVSVQASGPASSSQIAPVVEPLTFMRIPRMESNVPYLAEPAVGDIGVNDRTITQADVFAEAQHHPSDDGDSALKAAARALVIKELLLQEAARKEVTAVPEKDSAGLVETPDDALMRQLIEQEVAVPVADDEECSRYYTNNPHRFLTDTLYEARHILLAANKNNKSDYEAKKQQAQTLLDYLRDHMNEFSLMAEQHSDCSSSAHGGNLGQLTPGSTVIEFEEALVDLKQGEICSFPIESRYGFHLVIVDRCVRGEVLPFEAVSERIAAWLEASSWSRAVSQYITILAGRARISGISLTDTDSPLVQ